MERKVYDVAVVGAGASGTVAAITAARAGARVILLEHMDQPAKKILSTGNGRCNYTNADWDTGSYFCGRPGFVQGILSRFPYDATIAFFEGLGIRPVQKNGSCIYPESGQASSVRSVLLSETERLGIPLVTSLGIRGIKKDGGMFVISAKTGMYYSRTCILATGGKAAKNTGSDGSGYLYAQGFGHRIKKPLPALVALAADYKKWRLPSGVRVPCAASLFIQKGKAEKGGRDCFDKRAARECGELQVTDYGISGIVIFQLSGLASRALDGGRRVCVSLDFKPDEPSERLFSYLGGRFFSDYLRDRSVCGALTGFLPDRLAAALTVRAGLPEHLRASACTERDIHRLCRVIKDCRIEITGTKGFDHAQVTSGGLDVSELDAETLESSLVPGLYFCGEILDVDAKCGGYNLQWAWSSGAVAGSAAAAFCSPQRAAGRASAEK